LKGIAVNVKSKLTINYGTDFEKVIDADINRADIIFCLVNTDYLHDCEDEIETIKNLYNLKRTRVIPIITAECFDTLFFDKLLPIKIKDFDCPEKAWHKAAICLQSYLNEKFDKTKMFTIAPYKVAAGKNIGYGGVRDVDDDTIRLKNYIKGDAVFEVDGDSMSPHVNSGDYVHCRKCEDVSEIIDGKIYILETSNGYMLKIVESNGKNFTLKSINTEVQKDFDIEKNEIKTFWKAINKLSISEL